MVSCSPLPKSTGRKQIQLKTHLRTTALIHETARKLAASHGTTLLGIQVPKPTQQKNSSTSWTNVFQETILFRRSSTDTRLNLAIPASQTRNPSSRHITKQASPIARQHQLRNPWKNATAEWKTNAPSKDNALQTTLSNKLLSQPA